MLQRSWRPPGPYIRVISHPFDWLLDIAGHSRLVSTPVCQIVEEGLEMGERACLFCYVRMCVSGDGQVGGNSPIERGTGQVSFLGKRK